MHRSPWRYLLHVCIAGYVVCALMWSMPAETPLKKQLDRIASPFFQPIGLWQSWNMFAPSPRTEDIYVDAKAQLADGRQIELNLSQMWAMSTTERYRKERWRKFFNDHIRMDTNRSKWPLVAAWIQKDIESSEHVPVTHFALWRHWRVSKPGLLAASNRNSDWKSYMFYETPALSTKSVISEQLTSPHQTGVRR